MGAWGYGVYENDYALDFLHVMEGTTVMNFIDIALSQDDEHVTRLGAKVLCDNYHTLRLLSYEEDNYDVDKQLRGYVDAYKEMLGSVWHLSWNDFDEIERAMADELGMLVGLLTKDWT